MHAVLYKMGQKGGGKSIGTPGKCKAKKEGKAELDKVDINAGNVN